MDYAAEQSMEIEALQAIFEDRLHPYIGTTPAGWTNTVNEPYKITIVPTEDGEEAQEGAAELELEFLFQHTADYPDSAPCIKLRSAAGLSDADLVQCTHVLEQQIEENKGMAMIFTLHTAAKEWLRERSVQSAVMDPEVLAKKAIEQAEAKRAAARAHGTPVTMQAFLAWRTKFEAEQALAKAKAAEAKPEDARDQRMTGKQWFLQRGDAAAEVDEDVEDEDESDDEALQDCEEEDEEDIDFEDDDEAEDFLDELVPSRP